MMGAGVILPTAGKLDPSKLRPVGDMILLRVLNKERSVGGIILPNGQRSECLFGEVVAVGKGETSVRTGHTIPLPYKPGDRLLAMDYAGERMEIGGEKYRFLHANGIWARVVISDMESLELAAVSPVTDHIVVELEDEEVSQGGIVMPADPQLSYRRATVKATVEYGAWYDAKTDKTMEVGVRAGDRIVMLRYAGAVLTVGGRTARIIQKSDVITVIEDGV